MQAQRLQFQQDTVAVGAEVAATAVFRYPVGSVLVMPDSAKGYAPFERARQQVLRTDTEGLWQTDSVYLVLRTFRLDSVQRLALPYHYVDNGDTVQAVLAPDSVRLVYRKPVVRAGEPLVPQVSLAPIVRPFPIALVLAVVAMVLALGATAYLFGREPYRRWRRRRALDRRFAQLQAEVQALQALRERDPVAYLNRLNAAWRAFLQEDFAVALPSLTPRELDRLLREQPVLASDHAELLVQLSQWEEALNYAHRAVPAEGLHHSLQRLREVLAATYTRRKEAIG